MYTEKSNFHWLQQCGTSYLETLNISISANMSCE